ncbi:MAG: YabP/YqfC family sporulation protein [Clostridia bacterium]|nr:YabP/YqfC family sporulation protein [Clostridia bacterium]
MKEKRLFRRALHAAELPQDLDPHLFFVQWLGDRELLIEQHRGILRFEQNLIRFQTEQGILSVVGKNLEMDCLTTTRSLISGFVSGISLEEKS